MKCSFLGYIQLLIISWAIRAKNVHQNTKKQKRLPKSLKNKMFVFQLRSTSDDWPSNLSKKCWPKHKKRPPKSSKIKCLFLDYFQLLMIGWAIWVMNGDWNARKGLLSHQKIKCSFLMVYQKTTRRLSEESQKTSRRLPEDWQKTSRRQAEDYQKSSRRPAETTRRLPEDHQKTTRRLPEDHQTISWAIWVKNIETKMQKTEKGPLSHWKIKCSFLDYIQLLMISQVIWAETSIEMQKNEKGPLSHQKIKCPFLDYVQLLMIGWAI